MSHRFQKQIAAVLCLLCCVALGLSSADTFNDGSYADAVLFPQGLPENEHLLSYVGVGDTLYLLTDLALYQTAAPDFAEPQKLCDVPGKGLYHDVTLLSMDGGLYLLTQWDGKLYKASIENGKLNTELVVAMDWTNMYSHQPDQQFPDGLTHVIATPVLTKDALYLIVVEAAMDEDGVESYAEQSIVARFDLKTGARTNLACVQNATELAPYQDGKLLAMLGTACIDSVMDNPQLASIDPVSDTLTVLDTLNLFDGGLAYDPVQDRILYIQREDESEDADGRVELVVWQGQQDCFYCGYFLSADDRSTRCVPAIVTGQYYVIDTYVEGTYQDSLDVCWLDAPTDG